MEMPIANHILVQAIIFWLVTLVLSHLVFRPILRILEERKSRMSGDREEARVLSEKAEARMKEYEMRLDQAKTEAKEVKNQMLQDAGKKERDVLAQAREEASAIIAAAKAQLEKEGRDLAPRLEQEAKGLAREMAGLVLGREVA